jgi:hypothetical protein
MESLATKVDMLSKTIVNSEREDLTVEETKRAKNDLVSKNLLFPRSVKATNDPVILSQEYGLISFTPAKDVQPNKNGIYGVIKLRGNFPTLEESEQYSENLIRNHDSYNEIHIVRVGQCIPLSKNSELVEETINVDVNKEVDKIMSENVKEKRKQEKEDIKTIKEREEKLLKENKEILQDVYEKEPLEEYIMLRVKKAQLMWTLVETRKRIEKEIIPAIKKVKNEIQEWNEKYPTFDKEYYERYMEARKSVGIEAQDKLNYSYFMNYLMDDNDEKLE